MDYKDLLKNRRSVRSYEDRKVPLEVLHEIIQETSLAPSARNLQPWRFIIIQDSHLMKRISEESKKNWLKEMENHPGEFPKAYESNFKNPDFNVFYDATSLVMICGMKSSYYFPEDCSLAAAYFMFAATEKKLGTCWVAFGSKIEDPKLRLEIGLTDDLEIVSPLIIGYPKSIPNYPKRTPIILKEIVEG
jgi:nitroreductase